MAKQTDLILMHMKKYGSITHLEAESEYGIARLAPESMTCADRVWLSRARWSPVRTDARRLPTLRDTALRRWQNED